MQLYNQFLIDPICRYITAFCTHLILEYIYAAELALAGLDLALNISDDVFDLNQEEHDARLYQVMQWLHAQMRFFD